MLKSALLHPPQTLRHIELRAGLLLDFLDLHARRELGESQTALLAVDLEDALQDVSGSWQHAFESQDSPGR